MLRVGWQRVVGLFDSTFFAKRLPFLLSIIAIISGLATYAAINYGGVSLAQRTFLTMPFIAFDLVLVVLLCVVIGHRLLEISRAQRREAIGARLHRTILSVFTLVTITPSFVVALLAMTFFKSGVSVWFSTPVRETLNDACLVAELYLQEHMRGIRYETIAVLTKLRQLLPYFDLNSEREQQALRKELDAILEEQHLEEALILFLNQRTHEAISINSSFAFSLELSALEGTKNDDLNSLKPGEVIMKENRGMVQALTFADPNIPDMGMYLWVGKEIDKDIIKYVTKARDSRQYYNELLQNQHQFQIVLITLFALSSLLLLLAAIWTGLSLANILVEPITRLIGAADSVSKGDLSVRIHESSVGNEIDNLVHSFNRMVEMLEQQNKDLIISEKKSAWADIARKIAHEVKNPLTPIQLSAERLKRRYLPEIQKDPETFLKCTETIVRQVSHIENLINEFSAFARMPEAVIAKTDLTQLANDAVFLQKQAFHSIRFSVHATPSPLIWPCDGQQISQVFTNLLQNAANAIIENGDGSGAGEIVLQLAKQSDGSLALVVEDNGPGFPAGSRERLFEPYYTTRKKGTGLGMAIVLRIVTEHQGKLELMDAIGHRGARVEIKLPELAV